MKYYIINDQFYTTDELYHHGVKGMKWGVRRHQNANGSLNDTSSKKKNRAAAEKVLADKKSKSKTTKDKAKRNIAKGTKTVSTVLSKIGLAYIGDQVFWGGRGTKAVNAVTRNIGNAAYERYLYRGVKRVR